jgi:hypothetical protein
MIIQQVEVKRYNHAGELVLIYSDEVAVKQDTPVYPDLQAQLKAERWNMQCPSDSKLDNRQIVRLFENKPLTRRR